MQELLKVRRVLGKARLIFLKTLLVLDAPRGKMP